MKKGLPPPHKRHLRRHDGHELHVDVERQVGHVQPGVATCFTSISGSGLTEPSACGTPLAMRAARSVNALPMSIWLAVMSFLRPSSEMHLVSPVTACLVEV